MTVVPLNPYQGFGIGGQIGAYRGAGQALGGNSVNPAYQGNPGWTQTLPIHTGTVEGGTCDYTGTRPRKGTNLRAGEIVAFRAWRVRGGNRLYSVAFDSYEWFPGIRAEGHPEDKIDHEFAAGVHAFKDPAYAEDYLRGCSPAQIPFVLGEVALWGTVHEHSLGYRAQFAKPLKFQRATHPDIDLDALRARYGIEDKT